jgi:hypothetical protein
LLSPSISDFISSPFKYVRNLKEQRFRKSGFQNRSLERANQVRKDRRNTPRRQRQDRKSVNNQEGERQALPLFFIDGLLMLGLKPRLFVRKNPEPFRRLLKNLYHQMRLPLLVHGMEANHDMNVDSNWGGIEKRPPFVCFSS